MRYVLIVIAVVAFCVPAFAQGGNEGAKVFITFTSPTPDNGSVVNRADPAPYETFYAYIGVTDLGVGMQGIAFMMNDLLVEYPGVFSPPTFENLLPGDLAIGNYLTGITLASTECMNVDSDASREYIDPVIFAKLTLFYLGGVAQVKILDHPEYPRWLMNCEEPSVVDFYCVWTHGGVGEDALPGDIGCEADSPVELQTWGAIKSLFR